MKIEILGDGCARCKALKRNVQQAVEALGLAAEVTSVMDPERIADLEVLRLPQLVIDGEVALSGTPGSFQAIQKLLRDADRETRSR